MTGGEPSPVPQTSTGEAVPEAKGNGVYTITRKLSAVGEITTFYVERTWGFSSGDTVKLLVSRPESRKYYFRPDARIYSKTGTKLAITIPKVWGFRKGDMVTVSISKTGGVIEEFMDIARVTDGYERLLSPEIKVETVCLQPQKPIRKGKQ